MRSFLTCLFAVSVWVMAPAGASAPRTLGPLDPASAADNWPQWHGPGGLAVGSGTEYPDTWSATEHIAVRDRQVSRALRLAAG